VGGILAIVGATATGKSELALGVAARAGGEIVNADAFQLYRGLDIGTAKPSAEDRRRVRHHLVDILGPDERCSAGHYARLAGAVLADIRRRGQVAVVVGGSGLYLRALFGGLADLPPADLAVRAELEARLIREGLPALRAELEQADAATAARLAPGDTQRTLRALEVVASSGRPLSRWISESPPRPRLEARRVGLTLPRSVLYDRIGSRVRRMVEAGWLDEVRKLIAAGVAADAPAFRAIGYSEWARHVAGDGDEAETVRRIVAATRRYAKRQETWFRRESDVEWHDARETASLADELAEALSAGARRGAE
jgi:tRNA dimethylallyltransferase